MAEAAAAGGAARANRLDRLARTLLERETLEEDEAYAAAGLTPGAAPADADHVAPASVR